VDDKRRDESRRGARGEMTRGVPGEKRKGERGPAKMLSIRE
jgi:hypothetical protein